MTYRRAVDVYIGRYKYVLEEDCDVPQFPVSLLKCFSNQCKHFRSVYGRRKFCELNGRPVGMKRGQTKRGQTRFDGERRPPVLGVITDSRHH